MSRAQNISTKETVALKFTKDLISAHREVQSVFFFLLMALSLRYTEYHNLTKSFFPSQARMITRIHSSPGVSRSNFVKLLDCFTNGSQVCLVYEMLSVDLLKALDLRKLKPWSLAQIRPVAKQVQGHKRSADFLLRKRVRES